MYSHRAAMRRDATQSCLLAAQHTQCLPRYASNMVEDGVNRDSESAELVASMRMAIDLGEGLILSMDPGQRL